MNPDTENLVTAAADLGRRDTDRLLDAYELDEDRSLIVSRIRTDEHVVVTDLEPQLAAPRRARGGAALHDPGDFAAYVKRLANPQHTSVWADIESGRVTAVLDDHAHVSLPGWRSHTAHLALQPDPDWQAWTKLDGQLVDQLQFAEFLEQRMHSIINPAAADIYEVATSLQAKRTVAFRSGLRQKSGDVTFTYDEQTTAQAGQKGQLEIPDQFVIRAAPFAYVAPVELTAKLRYRISSGDLRIGYQLLRPEEIRRDAFSVIVGEIRGYLGDELPVFLGSVPRLT
ncbi:hypothetical protein ALI144C_44960 [Actinosynnema sp. ALI-1.44]|uniref:DUF2303 family protein n=1 Tax=Actinosynnema sp. ALI-1.44 TaxID=1933779 RepID=UPI00097C5EA8|nr:DUF2303 family protein [Actinosynnema sp. ALI-1.44]ONI73104.1 hypothetical protein ALI144C_44960 [Actinosynnema sp. ALI-1.44]